MGLETALLFCAIRANEVLGTLSYTRDTRAGYEIALCMEPEAYELSNHCLNEPGLVLEALLNPARFGSVTSCYSTPFVKALTNLPPKSQDRLQPSGQ